MSLVSLFREEGGSKWGWDGEKLMSEAGTERGTKERVGRIERLREIGRGRDKDDGSEIATEGPGEVDGRKARMEGWSKS